MCSASDQNYSSMRPHKTSMAVKLPSRKKAYLRLLIAARVGLWAMQLVPAAACQCSEVVGITWPTVCDVVAPAASARDCTALRVRVQPLTQARDVKHCQTKQRGSQRRGPFHQQSELHLHPLAPGGRASFGSAPHAPPGRVRAALLGAASRRRTHAAASLRRGGGGGRAGRTGSLSLRLRVPVPCLSRRCRAPGACAAWQLRRR